MPVHALKARGIGYEALSLLESTLLLFNQNNSLIKREKLARHGALKQELKADLDSYFNELWDGISFVRFRQYPRYMKAFGFRIQRAFQEPLKYGRKKEELAIYTDSLKKWISREKQSDLWFEIEEFREMVEEYGISLFAQQEIKTLFPVSVKRLEKKIAQMELLLKKSRN